MICKKQKALLHIYRDAAGISDPSYRAILRSKAGVNSSAAPGMTQSGFEHAMAALETVLWQRHAAGEIPDPRARSRWIAAEYYWRGKLPTRNRVNTRQLYQLDRLWNQLREFLPDDQCTPDYLSRIITKATGRPCLVHELSAHHAGMVIDALRDRLAYAIRSNSSFVVPSEQRGDGPQKPAREEVPF